MHEMGTKERMLPLPATDRLIDVAEYTSAQFMRVCLQSRYVHLHIYIYDFYNVIHGSSGGSGTDLVAEGVVLGPVVLLSRGSTKFQRPQSTHSFISGTHSGNDGNSFSSFKIFSMTSWTRWARISRLQFFSFTVSHVHT